MPGPGDYTVGWICAVETEHVAARAFLDEIHPGPSSISRHDNNAYTLGEIGNYNVVMAVAPDGEYGITSAAAVGRNMLHTFPNIRIGLMVGIGGGVPGTKNDIGLGDIGLGDIVVSDPRNGYGSVSPYNYWNTIQTQSL